MIKEITQAVINLYNRNSALPQVLTGGLHFQMAPQHPTSPYAVFYISGITQEDYMGGATSEIVQSMIQFNIFSEATDGGEEMATLEQLFTNCFHWETNVAIYGFYNVRMSRDSIIPIGYVDDIWQLTINYEFWMVKE